MPTNMEVKAILSDTLTVEATAIRLSGGDPEVIQQVDIFFRSGLARLKLRIFGPTLGELIRYQRADRPDARASHYSIARTSDPHVLCDILSETLGTVGTVKKTRRLFLIGQTRVHLDHVEGLGDFLELEVVLRPEQSEVEGHRIISGLLSDFGIHPAQLVAEAYIDLLCSKASLRLLL
ncbi:MAG: class IV adenylate cyclase [Acidobacteriaceae bacterium]|nr:class IV adenylate cyclase [Acidobacteriaceae bacterium]MBV9222497.1 class IV adenylate cyclase [Acidobacteriaceae bacterium]